MTTETDLPDGPIAVIGSGAWGTALAQSMVKAGHTVHLWAREPEVVESINTERFNVLYLPHIRLDDAIRATGDLDEAIDGATVVLMVTPAQHTADVTALLPANDAPIVIAAKGLRTADGAMMTDAVAAVRPDARLAVLAGPSFAEEVAVGLPTAVTLACADETLGRQLLDRLGSRALRPYWTDDLIGVQIGGAVKNVLAIAAGVADGRNLGHNARAALITRGMAEMTRLGVAMGARPETMTGLSGLGDLILTSSSLWSRNTSLGHALAHGRELGSILRGRQGVTEGVSTVSAVVAKAEQLGVDMPVCRAVDAMVNHGADLEATMAGLLDRPFRAEADGRAPAP